MYNKVITELTKSGYKCLRKDSDGVGIFYKDERVVVTILIDSNNNYSVDFFANINNFIERKFDESGFTHVEYIKLIFTDNPSQLKEALCFDSSYWIFDLSKNLLLVYDGQPYTFGDLKSVIEKSIYGGNSFSKTSLKKFPYITCLLVVLNVAYYIVIKNNGGFDNYTMAKFGAAVTTYIVERKEYYRIFTSMFMHFGIEHLYMNMISLLIMGSSLEQMVGRLKFLIIYIGSGIGGGIVSVVSYYMQDKLVISAGASGAIFGVLGALALINYTEQKHNIKRQSMSPKTILMFVVLSVLSGFGNSGYDVYAHIGGFVWGIILAWLFNKNIIKLHNEKLM